MNSNSKILAYSLLILFGAMQLLNLFSLMSLQSHKIEVKQHLKFAKKYEHLFFTKEKWQHVKKVNKDEIQINGRMFDIKHINITQNIVEVYGHFDTKEDKLLAQSKESEKQLTKKNATMQLYVFEKIESFALRKIFQEIAFYNIENLASILKGFCGRCEQPPRV